MKLAKFCVLCAALVALAFGGTASAHAGTPVSSIVKRIGMYTMAIEYYNEPRGGQALEFSITPVEQRDAAYRYSVTAVPGPAVDAVPVTAVLQPDPAHRGGVHGRVKLPVSGQWLLSVEIDGLHGPVDDDVPVLAGGTPAIPQWAGWMIGLVPVWVIIGLIGALAVRAGRTRAIPAGG